MQRTGRGQVTVEYFLLFAVVIALTVLGVTSFHTDIRTALEDFFTSLAKTMATPP